MTLQEWAQLFHAHTVDPRCSLILLYSSQSRLHITTRDDLFHQTRYCVCVDCFLVLCRNIPQPAFSTFGFHPILQKVGLIEER